MQYISYTCVHILHTFVVVETAFLNIKGGVIMSQLQGSWTQIDSLLPSLCFLSALHIYLPIRQFFYDIIHPEYSPVCDVYAMMFLIDVVNFIVIIFGYGAFGVSTINLLKATFWITDLMREQM